MSFFDPRNFKLAQKGFGLIEALIAAGLMVVLGLGIANLMSAGSKMNRTTHAASDLENAMGLLNLALSDATTCGHNLAGKTLPPSGSPLPITWNLTTASNNNVLYTPNSTLPDMPGTSTTLDLVDFIPISANQTLANIRMTANKGAVYGSSTGISKIPVSLAMAGNAITGCVTPGTSTSNPQSTCVSLGGTWVPSSNSCSFGTPTAQCSSLGGSWNGTACVFPGPSNPNECANLGGTWTGTSCQFAGAGNATQCANLGGTWNGTSCQFAGSTTTGSANCASLGGTWNGTSCSLPTTAANNSSGASMCAALGGTWNGSACSFPSSNPSNTSSTKWWVCNCPGFGGGGLSSSDMSGQLCHQGLPGAVYYSCTPF